MRPAAAWLPHDEQLLWLRQQARVQRVVSATVRQMAARIEQLEADLLRLRAQAVLERTAQFWAVPALPRSPRPAPQRNRTETAWPDANQVLCQTACVGHAHPWLGADGQCRRSGQECQRLNENRNDHVPAT